MDVPDSALTQAGLEAELQSAFAVYNQEYTYINIGSIVVSALTADSATVTFDYRSGDPYLTCGENACGTLPSYSQRRTISEGGRQDKADVQPPAE